MNLIIHEHLVNSAKANWCKSHDAVFDPNAVSLGLFEKTDLSVVGLIEVSLGKLEDGEEDDSDGAEAGEENPVELVEKAEVWAAFQDEATRVSNKN